MKKLTLEDVKETFEQHNMIMLDEEYIDNQTKIQYKCKIHNEEIQSITLGNLKSGKGCKFCGIEKRKKSQRKEINLVTKSIEEIGFQIINPEKYENISSILTFRCKNGHEFEMRYGNLLNRKRCTVCTGKFPLTENMVRKFVESRDYKLIKFIDSQSDITVVCPNSHTTNIGWDRFKRGQECVICTGNQPFKYNYDQVYEFFKQINLKLISNSYENAHQKLDFICENGHKGSMPLVHVLRGHGCSACRFTKAVKTMTNNGKIKTSKQQKFIHEIIGGELNFPINQFVLDIAFPNEKFYLEYDGGGHFLKVILGDVSMEDFKKREMIRSKILKTKGWKEIRIVSKSDRLPTKDKLIEMKKYAYDYLVNSQKNHIIFNLDESEIETSLFKIKYEYGKLSELNY